MFPHSHSVYNLQAGATKCVLTFSRLSLPLLVWTWSKLCFYYCLDIITELDTPITVCEVTYHIKYGWNLIFRHLAVHNNVVAVQTEANKKWLHLLYHSFSQDAPPLSINTSTVICFTMCALVCVVCLVLFPYPAQLSVTSGMVKVGEGLVSFLM